MRVVPKEVPIPPTAQVAGNGGSIGVGVSEATGGKAILRRWCTTTRRLRVIEACREDEEEEEKSWGRVAREDRYDLTSDPEGESM